LIASLPIRFQVFILIFLTFSDIRAAQISGYVLLSDLTTAQGVEKNCRWLPLECVADFKSFYGCLKTSAGF
jgi:hypothetical protein